MRDVDLHDEQALQSDLAARRADLLAAVDELKRTIEDTLDVKAHARRALDRGRDRARTAADRGMTYARARPVPVIGGALGLLALGAFLLARRRRDDDVLFDEDVEVEIVHGVNCTCC